MKYAYEKYEYGYLDSWYIKSTFIKGSYIKINFQKNKVLSGKNPFFVIRLLGISHYVFLALPSDRVVLYGNFASSILLLSTKKQYSSFLKKAFVFQKYAFES